MSDTADLLTGIQTAFNGSSDLMAIFPNGVYHGDQPDSTPKPYCVVSLISQVPEFDTGRELDTYRVQFSAFTSSDNGDTTALAAKKAINKAFNFAELPFATQQCVMTYPLGGGVMAEDMNTWHVWQDFRIQTGNKLS